MLKVIGIICVISTSIGIGTYYIQRDKERLYLLREIKKMILLWRGSVRQCNETIPELLHNISTRLDKRLELLLSNIVNKMNEMNCKEVRKMWEDEVNKRFANSSLDVEDIQCLKKIGDIIGLLDKKLQIENMNNCELDIDERIRNLCSEMAQKHRVCRTMSIMGGIFIVIIFI